MLARIRTGYDRFGGWLADVAFIVLLAATFFTVGNAIARQFHSPVGGATEIISYSAAAIISLSLAYSQAMKVHTVIDVVSAHIPNTPRDAIRSVMLLISSAVLLIASWEIVSLALSWKRMGLLSETLRIPHYPLLILIGFGIALFAVRVILDAFASIMDVSNELRRKRDE